MAKLNKMKTDKYRQTGTIYFKKKFNTAELCHVCAKEFWGRLSLLQPLRRLRQNGCHSVNSKTEWYIILVPFC